MPIFTFDWSVSAFTGFTTTQPNAFPSVKPKILFFYFPIFAILHCSKSLDLCENKENGRIPYYVLCRMQDTYTQHHSAPPLPRPTFVIRMSRVLHGQHARAPTNRLVIINSQKG